jgi:hypothetical protein
MNEDSNRPSDLRCKWTQDGYGEEAWQTSCGRRFYLNEGTPADNGLRSCCFCGKPLDQYPVEEEFDD